MDYTKAIEEIKMKRRQGLLQSVARKAGVSLPTVRKYLIEGNIVSPKELEARIRSVLRRVEKNGALGIPSSGVILWLNHLKNGGRTDLVDKHYSGQFVRWFIHAGRSGIGSGASGVFLFVDFFLCWHRRQKFWCRSMSCRIFGQK